MKYDKEIRLNAKAVEHITSTEYNFSVAFYLFQENGRYIAYCPSLGLSSSGDDHLDAIKNFYECLQLHVECCIDMGTLLEDLKAHGWKVTNQAIKPPSYKVLIRKPEMAKLVEGDINYEKIVTPVKIPALA